MTINLFVGDNTENLANAACEFDSTAKLIDTGNYQKFLNQNYITDVTFYTSLSDLPKITRKRSVPFEVFSKADKIFYRPPVRWSDHLDTFVWAKQQQLTEYYLYHINLKHNNVDGLDISGYKNSLYLKLQDQRSSDDKTLWMVGCSITHGIGVDQSEKYGQLIADKLKIPVCYLTKGGTSIEWAADQILRSDIRSNDIVIWGITYENRTVKAINGDVKIENNVDILFDETRLYHAITKVHQVVNFCKKISAKLILLPLICSESAQLILQHLDDYYQIPYHHWFLDKGDDGVHPGPGQHREWADFCLDILKS